MPRTKAAPTGHFYAALRQHNNTFRVRNLLRCVRSLPGSVCQLPDRCAGRARRRCCSPGDIVVLADYPDRTGVRVQDSRVEHVADRNGRGGHEGEQRGHEGKEERREGVHDRDGAREREATFD